MTWASLIPLLIQYGAEYGPQAIAYVEKLWQLWNSNAAPTQADFDALRALLSQSAADRMKANLIAAGIDPTSPQGVQLIALAGGKSSAP